MTLSSFTHVTIPADRRVYHWSRTPWGRLHHYFRSFLWDIPKTVDAAVSFITDVIVSAAQKFVPSSIPKLSRPRIVIAKQHGERKWTSGRVMILQDFVEPHIEPPLFISKQSENIRSVFVRGLGTVVGVNSGGHSYQVWLGVAVRVGQQSPQLINWPPTSLLNYPAHPC